MKIVTSIRPVKAASGAKSPLSDRKNRPALLRVAHSTRKAIEENKGHEHKFPLYPK